MQHLRHVNHIEYLTSQSTQHLIIDSCDQTCINIKHQVLIFWLSAYSGSFGINLKYKKMNIL